MSNYIGSTFSLVAGVPATEDQSGYEALTFVEVGKVVTIGEIGDTHEDISSNLLKVGRVEHDNGAADGGEVAIVIEDGGADAGQALVKGGSGSTTIYSCKISDTDGKDYYFQGILSNYRHRERSTSVRKGFSFAARVNTGITEV